MKNAHISEFKLSFFRMRQMKFLAKVQKTSWNLKKNQVDHILKVTQPGAAYLLANPSNINATLDCIFDKFSWSAHHFSMMDQSVAGGRYIFLNIPTKIWLKSASKLSECLTIDSVFDALSNEWQRVRYKGLLFLSTLLQATSNTRASMIKIQWLSSGNLDQIIWWW